MFGSLLLAAYVATTRVAVFSETDELLANPGMGWETFHTTADRDSALQGLPSSTAYYRFYWREIEPQEGRIDFAKMDGILSQVHKAGQRLSFRVMCAGSGEPIDVPQWLKDEGCRGYEYDSEGQKAWIPDFEDPLFQQAHFRLIRELGKRYGAHPDVDLVDVGSVGLWGEWHMSGTVGTDGKEVPLPSIQTRKRIVDAWCAAFPRKPRAMLIGGGEILRYAIVKDCGWRADCLGDMGGFSKTWNHMRDMYPQALREFKAEDAWRRGPVAFESCWDMRKWVQEGWSVRDIFDYALSHHASYINNKSAPLPEGTKPEVERLLRRLGYRLVLRSATFAPTWLRGQRGTVEMDWENVGVAPPYGEYRIAFRLRGPVTAVDVGSVSIKGWLPGNNRTKSTVSLVPTTPGRYALDLAVVDPKTRTPVIRLAIAGRRQDGWYPLGDVDVR